MLICVCVCVQLCKAGLKTLQDLGPEMRLALNEDLEEDEEEVMMEEEEELEEDTTYKVFINASQSLKVMSESVTSLTGRLCARQPSAL